MNLLTTFLLMGPAAAPAGAEGQQPSAWPTILMFGAIILVMWLFMIRPQQKKQKEVEKFRQGLKKGDKVVTIGGIYGTVAEVKENTLILEVDQNVKIKVDKSSVVKDFSDAQQA